MPRQSPALLQSHALPRISALVLALGIALASALEAVSAPFDIKRGLGVGGPFVSVVKRQRVINGEKAPQQVFRGLQKYLGQANYAAPKIKEMGFDFIRLSVNPAILLRSEGADREDLLATLEQGVDYYRSAGLKVLFNLQFWTPDEVWNWESVLNPNGAQFEAYREVVRQSAKLLLKYPQGDVALEPMNEPNSTNCNDPVTGWLAKQRTLIADIRAIDRRLPVLLSGCIGQLDGLLTLNARNVDMTDPNLIYSFHFYEPFFFTHQTSALHYPNINTVRYPANTSTLETSLTGALNTIDRAGNPPEKKDAERAVARKEFAKYYTAMPDRSLIQQRFAKVTQWARQYGIPSDRIILGEFAALNWSSTDSDDFRRSRVAWDRDVRKEAEAAGFAWTFWASPLKDDIVDALDLKPATPVPAGKTN